MDFRNASIHGSEMTLGVIFDRFRAAARCRLCHNPPNTGQMAFGIGRREILAGLGSAALAWPHAARAQKPAIPVIGYLSGSSPDDSIDILADFRRGLAETGNVEGRNVAIEYRWLEGRYDRIPTMLGDLVERRVAVIALANTTTAALAAKAATQTIPIVFAVGTDPVAVGLVSSLNRPGGNLTGISLQQTAAAAQRLELLHQVKPAERSIAFLVDGANPSYAAAETREMQSAANVLGVDLVVLNASSTSEIEAAFLTMVQRRAGALLIGGDIFFISRTDQLVALAARHAVPAMYTFIEQARAGGLIAYGAHLTELERLVGVYCGRILNGEKPADLPVQLLTKVELVINLKTAKALGLTFPLTLLGRADEVIE
jgi:putative tryptophan/tyrosine transport system substrate-binding protein